MRQDDAARLKLWAEAWKAAGPALERLREEEVRRADTVRAVLALSDAAGGLPPLPPRPTSGLVEQQALFRKLRR